MREFGLQKTGSSARPLRPLSIALFTLLCVMLLSAPSYAGINAGPSGLHKNFRHGKELFEKGRYDESIVAFRTAYGELPVIGDYTLLFMAKAHNRMERFDDSERCIDQLLKEYPDSSLKKKARALRLRNLVLSRETTPLNQKAQGGYADSLTPDRAAVVIKHLESYVNDYPDDAEMLFFMARMMKKIGKIDTAKKLFIRIYIGNSPFSEAAYRELKPSDIKPDDMFAKALNLMKAYEFSTAETILRKILPFAGDSLHEDVQKNLGLALFRQKRYKEAAGAFLKAGDLYNGARSLYRAGDFGAFMKTVEELVTMEDKRAGPLLIAYASKKRREGKTEEALEIYNDVAVKYPSLAEDILWGIAWTHYRKGDHRKALDALTELNKKYPDPRYLYWSRRCMGHDMSLHGTPDEQQGLKGSKRDFYSLLASMRDAENLNSRSVTQATWGKPGRFPGLSGDPPSDILPAIERFAILREVEMKDDAAAEILRIANKASRPDVLVYLSRALQELGEYKRSIGLLSRLPEEKGIPDVSDILYPLAYWQTVGEVSAQYGLNPFILLSVIREESRFDPNARSIAGALGLMQIMPQTALALDRHLKLDIGDVSEIYNIRVNVSIGAYYLNSLLKEFVSLPVALAAYNAGHDRVREWIREGRYVSPDEFIEDIPYEETRNYVKRVLHTYFTYLNLTRGQ